MTEAPNNWHNSTEISKPVLLSAFYALERKTFSVCLKLFGKKT
jgi:hypothetical protein